jgi:hypothetical protein
MAYPYGDTAWKPLAASRFILARGVGPGMIAPLDGTDPYVLPTFAATGVETSATFISQLDSASSSGKWVIFLFHSLLPTTYNWYAGVDISTVTDSIADAKSKGALWLDSVVDVGSYWLAQKLVHDAPVATTSGVEKRSWTLPKGFPTGKYLRVTVDGGKLTQSGAELPWNAHGFYEVALDAGEVSWSP